MRTLRFTGPAPDASTTHVAARAEPGPGPDEVTVDVAYAGLNFIDVMARRGDPGYAPAWPFQPGLEIAGTVRAVGTEVAGLAPGDRVAAFTAGGGLAEVAVARAALTVRVPDGVDLAAAATAPLASATAVLLLTAVARIRPGESVLMHSAGGGVGSVVAQLAGPLGAGPTIGTVGRPDKIPSARQAGWDVALTRDDGLGAAVRAVAPGGVDVILDPTGTALLDLDLELAAPGGRVVLFGNAAGGAPTPLPPAGRLIGGNVGILGFSMSRLTERAPATAAGALREALDLMDAGRLGIPVTVIDGLDGVAEIHDQLATGRGRGKYVVRVRAASAAGSSAAPDR